MKNVALLFLLNASVGFSQTIPNVNATGGQGENVNWPTIKKEEEADTDGPGFFYHDCAQGVELIGVSSELKAQGAKNYSAKNLSDGDPMTAWVEGKPGYGIGESFSLKATTVNTIYNGYQSTPLNWKNNSRVKKFKVYLDNKVLCYLILKDEMGEQTFELPFEPDAEKKHLFKFEITDVYKGLKWDDVAISHIDYFACCMAEETLIMYDHEMEKSIAELNDNEKVLAINIQFGSTSEIAVSRIVKQTHLSLLEITTENHQIRATSDHPFFIKDEGFSSFSRLRSVRQLDNYTVLEGKLELMFWDEKRQQIYSEKVIGIKKVSGEFKTYTLKGLPEGSVYVANGFVTKNY